MWQILRSTERILSSNITLIFTYRLIIYVAKLFLLAKNRRFKIDPGFFHGKLFFHQQKPASPDYY